VKLCEFNLRSMQSRKVAEERLGVDVCLTEEILESAPECPHGKKMLTIHLNKISGLCAGATTKNKNDTNSLE